MAARTCENPSRPCQTGLSKPIRLCDHRVRERNSKKLAFESVKSYISSLLREAQKDLGILGLFSLAKMARFADPAPAGQPDERLRLDHSPTWPGLAAVPGELPLPGLSRLGLSPDRSVRRL